MSDGFFLLEKHEEMPELGDDESTWTVAKLSTPKPSRSDKFKEAAHELGCDDDEAHFDAQLKKLIKENPE